MELGNGSGLVAQPWSWAGSLCSMACVALERGDSKVGITYSRRVFMVWLATMEQDDWPSNIAWVATAGQ